MDDIIFKEYDVVCHNSECENSEITICVNAPLNNPYIVCGPCGVKIEDLSTVLEDDL